MNADLTPLQLLVAKHYCGGEFSHVETLNDARAVGDTLFVFAILEAGEMAGPYDLFGALDRAAGELRSLADDIGEV